MYNIIMKNKVKVLIYRYLPFFIFFMFTLYLTKQTSLMADDIRYLYRSAFNGILPNEKIINFYQVLESSIYDYIYANSRLVYTISLIEVLRFDLIVFRIINSLLITSTFYIGLKIARNRSSENINDFILDSLILLGFHSISYLTLDECFFWISGSVFYTWSAFFAISFLKYYLLDNNIKFYHYLIVIILAIFNGFAIETLALSMFVIIIFIIVLKLFIEKDKSYLNSLRIIGFISLCISTLIHFLSPVIKGRYVTESLSFLRRFYLGFVDYYSYQYIQSGVIVIFLIISLLLLVNKYNKKLSFIGLFISLPLIIIRFYINTIPSGYNTITNNKIGTYFIDGTNSIRLIPGNYLYKGIVIGYFLLLTLLLAYLIIYLYLKEKNIILLILFSMSTITNLSLWFTGIYAPRVSFYGQLFSLISLASLINIRYKDEISISKIIVCLLCFHFFLVSLENNMHNYKHNIKVGEIRNNLVKDIIKNGSQSKIIRLPRYKTSVNGNFEDEDTWQNATYRKYYLGSLDYELEFYDLD